MNQQELADIRAKVIKGINKEVDARKAKINRKISITKWTNATLYELIKSECKKYGISPYGVSEIMGYNFGKKRMKTGYIRE